MVFEDDNLLAVGVFHDRALDFGAGDVGRSDLDLLAVGYQQDFLEFDRLPHFKRQAIDFNLAAFFRKILLASVGENRVFHG